MKTWWILPVTLSLLALLPVLVRVIKRGQWRYRMPMLFSMLTFCVYAAQFTPCLYALGIIGAYRVQNLYRFSLYVLLLLNEWYWAGYLLSVWDKYKLGDSKFGVLLRRILTGIKLKTCIFSFLAVLVIAPIMLFRYGNTVTAVSAFRTLRSGEALQYYQENLERRSLLESDAEDVVLEPFTAAPYLLYFSDLKEQPDAWENVACAQYYGKRSVRVLRK